MKPRDTKLNFFDLPVKANKIEVEKATLGGEIAGKKLSLV